LKLIEGKRYFDTYKNMLAILECTDVSEFEYSLTIVVCTEQKYVGTNGTIPKNIENSLVLATALIEALL
jgi:hypothetical protein